MQDYDIDSMLFIGMKATVLALDRNTGIELWRTILRSGQFVNVALDGDSVYATSRGEIYCLDALTGSLRWHNPLKGMGWGLITIAGTSITPMVQQMNDEAAHAAAATPTASAAT